MTGFRLGIAILLGGSAAARAQQPARPNPWLPLSAHFPRATVDTTSLVMVDTARYRAHFRIRHARSIPVPGNPKLPWHIESGMVAEFRCRDRAFRPLTMLFVDTAGQQIAKTDAPGPWMVHPKETIGRLMIDGACRHITRGATK